MKSFGNGNELLRPLSKTTTKRWVLLIHIGAPDDPVGRHFDLLLEDGQGCRTWRLASIPSLDGPEVEATPTKIHKLSWINIKTATLSKGRGQVEQVDAGNYLGSLPNNQSRAVEIYIQGSLLQGHLQVRLNSCQLTAIKPS